MCNRQMHELPAPPPIASRGNLVDQGEPRLGSLVEGPEPQQTTGLATHSLNMNLNT
ncbi:MAG: hypothetical protein WAO08_13875 [Hyphomicrobiaceae bacterium]